MGRYSWFGIALILVGSTLLLDRFGIVRLGWEPVLWSLLAVFGAVRTTDGFGKKKSGRVFWGTFFFLSGVYGVLRYLDVVELRSYWPVPAFLAIIGLSLAMIVVNSPRNWPVLVPALLFLGSGSAIILSDYGYLYRHDVIYAFRTYWPTGIILFGLALVLKGFSLHTRVPKGQQ